MVAQTSWAPNRLPSCQSTSLRSFQVTHIAGVTETPPLLTAGQPEVRTSPLAVVGTSVASIGRQKSARLRAFAVSSTGRYQSRPSVIGASTATEESMLATIPGARNEVGSWTTPTVAVPPWLAGSSGPPVGAPGEGDPPPQAASSSSAAGSSLSADRKS